MEQMITHDRQINILVRNMTRIFDMSEETALEVLKGYGVMRLEDEILLDARREREITKQVISGLACLDSSDRLMRVMFRFRMGRKG